MDIDQAIKILTTWSKDNCPPRLADEFNALNLSIEALKVVKEFRRKENKGYITTVPSLLPGETKK